MLLDRVVGDRVPGYQFARVRSDGSVSVHVGGSGRLSPAQPMTDRTLLAGYSLTKPITAVATLKLVESGRLSLSAPLPEFFPDRPEWSGVTVRHLLAHTSGLPNPIPLRWVHLAEGHAGFDEAGALQSVLSRHARPLSPPGEKYRYSNLGYWLLGRIIDQAAGEPYEAFVQRSVIERLSVSQAELQFFPASVDRAGGYLPRRSLLNLIKRFVLDPSFWASSSGSWLEVRDHQVNGPSYGGLFGTARAFGAFLADLMSAQPALLRPETRDLLLEPQTDSRGRVIPVTLGWHVIERAGRRILSKPGGGAGFAAETRFDPETRAGWVLMTNSATFPVRRALDQLSDVE